MTKEEIEQMAASRMSPEHERLNAVVDEKQPHTDTAFRQFTSTDKYILE